MKKMIQRRRYLNSNNSNNNKAVMFLCLRLVVQSNYAAESQREPNASQTKPEQYTRVPRRSNLSLLAATGLSSSPEKVHDPFCGTAAAIMAPVVLVIRVRELLVVLVQDVVTAGSAVRAGSASSLGFRGRVGVARLVPHLRFCGWSPHIHRRVGPGIVVRS